MSENRPNNFANLNLNSEIPGIRYKVQGRDHEKKEARFESHFLQVFFQFIDPFPKRHRMVYNGGFPKFKGLYFSLNMVNSTEIS